VEKNFDNSFESHWTIKICVVFHFDKKIQQETRKLVILFLKNV
jgi:hypothetical protein